MCNIAGYVGTKQAAPILMDMILKQEGLAGGYYTGISTIHEGKLYYARITGDMQRLEESCRVSQLPGTVGLLHSRSKSGGDDRWAHPFIGADPDGRERTAYVANGAVGCFKDEKPRQDAIARELDAQGYHYTSRLHIDTPRYQSLADGCKVHISDVMCQLILRHMHAGLAPDQAMAQGFCDMPSEIVGLMLALDDPNCIFYSAFNMPMTLGMADHGTYLASAAIAMPDDARYVQQLPTNASGRVYAAHYEITPMPAPPLPVPPIDAHLLHRAYQVVADALTAGKKTRKQLHQLVLPLFDGAPCVPSSRALYEVLYALKREGRLVIETQRVPGALDHLTAPEFVLSLRDKM